MDMDELIGAPVVQFEAWRCVHCKRITFLQLFKRFKGNCPCGEEFYPMSRIIKHGSTHTISELLGEPLRRMAPMEGE